MLYYFVKTKQLISLINIMTEYWQSQARKYCEFCKCWYADNKVSISFHENGKRHKENVQKHIAKLTKKSSKDFKIKEKQDDDIKKMEAAAMAAYLKDVQNNADLTSQSINNMLGNDSTPTNISKTEEISPIVWHEVQSDTGSYFWNTETNETTWDPPDNYLSLAQQEEKKLKDKEEVKKKQRMKKEQQKESAKETKAFAARERMRELSVGGSEPQVAGASVALGPAPRPEQPFGSWMPVPKLEETQVDLQLPKVKEVAPPPVVLEPERFRFKERKIDSLGEGPVEFKKRKLNNPKRNMRQKTDDD